LGLHQMSDPGRLYSDRVAWSRRGGNGGHTDIPAPVLYPVFFENLPSLDSPRTKGT